MKKLEPGMLCRVSGAKIPENNGRHVTISKFVGCPPSELLSSAFKGWRGDDWWETEEVLYAGSPKGSNRVKVTYARACCLKPINPDHQPADEQWQADFKRMLNGQTVKN